MALVITLIILGALLLFAETLLPGMVAGIAGLVCLFAAVVLGYGESATVGNSVLGVVIFGSGVGIFSWFRYFPTSRFAKPYVSDGTIGGLDNTRHELLDQTGTAKTSLRPSGTAEINGERVDVVTEGSLIEPGTPLKVVAVEGLRVVVRAT
ncbi:MAG: NfeD family protein [Limisphaerales bacterium]